MTFASKSLASTVAAARGATRGYSSIVRRTALPSSLQKQQQLSPHLAPGSIGSTNSSATATQVRYHGGPSISADAPTVHLTFINPPSKSDSDDKPERLTVEARVGETLLQVAHRNHVEMEGACEGVCACSTCHVILSDELYERLAGEEDTEPSEDEEDMLDMAFGLTDTSRLGCQVTVGEEMEGEEIQLPSATRNFYVDGHVPQPH